MIVSIHEGLGNQLFQYAFARYAQHCGKTVYLNSEETIRFYNPNGAFDKRDYLLGHFNIKIKQASDRQLKKYSYIFQKTLMDQIKYCLAELGIWKYKVVDTSDLYGCGLDLIKENYYVIGVFQNQKLPNALRKELLCELTPKEKIKIPHQLKELICSEHVVSVHIRRGDFRWMHWCLPMSYYENAMSLVRNKIKNPIFLFFSDDMKWVKEQFGDSGSYRYIDDYGKYEDYEELFIMSRCKNNIIANSTFSWWAAWLNRADDKLVIAPRVFKGEEDPASADKLLPKDWIRL